MSSQTRLGAAAEDRKNRLAHLRSLKRKEPTPGDDFEPPPSVEQQPVDRTESDPSVHFPPEAPTQTHQDTSRLLSGRNYDPETREPRLGFYEPPVPNGPTLEQKAAEVESAIREKAAADAAGETGIDLFKLRPKKPNWDLRRDLERKLAPLDVRTDNAIARMVRQRIAEEQKKQRTTVAAAGSGGGGGGGGGENVEEDADAGALDGAALVEGLRMREQDDAEEERRERENEELDV